MVCFVLKTCTSLCILFQEEHGVSDKKWGSWLRLNAVKRNEFYSSITSQIPSIIMYMWNTSLIIRGFQLHFVVLPNLKPMLIFRLGEWKTWEINTCLKVTWNALFFIFCFTISSVLAFPRNQCRWKEKKGLLNIESAWSEFEKQLLKWYIRDPIQALH